MDASYIKMEDGLDRMIDSAWMDNYDRQVDRQTYRKTSFVNKSRSSVPWLDLWSEDDFDFSFVFSSFTKERTEDRVYRETHLGTELVDIYQWSKMKRYQALRNETKYLKGQT
jgi:hypothetical protein